MLSILVRFPTYYWFRCHYPLITYLTINISYEPHQFVDYFETFLMTVLLKCQMLKCQKIVLTYCFSGLLRSGKVNCKSWGRNIQRKLELDNENLVWTNLLPSRKEQNKIEMVFCSKIVLTNILLIKKNV